MTTTTITAPTDPDTYARWLSGRWAALACRISRVDEPIGAMEAQMLRDAAQAMLTALEDAERQGGIRD